MQEGGSQHGAPPPEMPPPVSSLPPPEFDEEEPAERGAPAGNRWPRDETLALLKLRSEMDAEFREATLKGPLWEEVSRRMAALGYARNGKKCREKFENVHKYYKRTKDHRAGRPDGKSYRFFSQLEALQSNINTNNDNNNNSSKNINTNNNNNNVMTAAASHTTPVLQPPAPTIHHPTPISSIPPPSLGPPLPLHSSSYSASDTEETDHEETRKRKRPHEGGRTRKMMAFFQGMMKEVMDRQEIMQGRFLEAIDRIEQDRLAREEAWRRQEVARSARESDVSARERAAAAARDAGIMALLQKLAGAPPAAAAALVASAPPSQAAALPAMVKQPENAGPAGGGQSGGGEAMDAAAVEQHQMEVTSGGGAEPVSSRWPKEEVHALIEIRTGMESRYQELGPKGPLWEEISAAMRRIGYNRNAKRCKEKWENINKYFKRVKESSKKRPGDSKTCPYFQQLDTIYKSKSIGSGNGSGTAAPSGSASAASLPEQHPLSLSRSIEVEEEEGRSNGDHSPCLQDGGKEDVTSENKPEDILKEGRQNGGLLHRMVDNIQMEDMFDGVKGDEHINLGKQSVSQMLESQGSIGNGGFSNFSIGKPKIMGGGTPFLALWSRNGVDGSSSHM